MSKAPALRNSTALMPGYDAAALDASIRRYTAVAERNLHFLEELDPQLKDALDRLKKAPVGLALDDVTSLSIIYDRLVKAGLNLVKATDELARLRSFVSGGPDSRPDLSSMSEIELRAVVLAAVRSLGITDLRQLEAVDVEVTPA